MSIVQIDEAVLHKIVLMSIPYRFSSLQIRIASEEVHYTIKQLDTGQIPPFDVKGRLWVSFHREQIAIHIQLEGFLGMMQWGVGWVKQLGLLRLPHYCWLKDGRTLMIKHTEIDHAIHINGYSHPFNTVLRITDLSIPSQLNVINATFDVIM